MGKRRTERHKRCKVYFSEALKEVYDALDGAVKSGSTPKRIEVKIVGPEEDTLVFEIEDLGEALEILRLNRED